MHRTWLLAACAGLLGMSVVTFGACADDGAVSAGGADGGSDAFDAAIPTDDTGSCEAWVDARCRREAECAGQSSPDPLCVAARHACPDIAFAAGSARTVENITTCILGIRALACVDLAAGRIPDGCVVAGKLTKGAPCLYGSQCNSLTCKGDGPGSCGTCAGRLAPGEDCTTAASDVVCPPNEACDTPSKTCQPVSGAGFGQEGEFCSGDVKDPVACVAAEGVTCLASAKGELDGTCAKLPGPGARCAWSPNQPRPVCAKGAYCRVEANGTGGECLALPTTGQPCGVLPGARSAVPCSKSSCRTPDGGATGTCFALVGKDGACTSSDDCDESTYCEITGVSPTRGTCRARPEAGGSCDDRAVPGGGGSTFAVPCAGQARCTADESGKRVCFAAPDPGSAGSSCAPPASNCSALLRCVKGTCTRPPPASCK